jgi:hypothetical protein
MQIHVLNSEYRYFKYSKIKLRTLIITTLTSKTQGGFTFNMNC